MSNILNSQENITKVLFNFYNQLSHTDHSRQISIQRFEISACVRHAVKTQGNRITPRERNRHMRNRLFPERGMRGQQI